MPRIANVKARDLIRLLHRMNFERYDRDHIYFYHEWLNLWTKISHGDKDIDAALMGRIAIRQLKMNSADEFRAALRGDIPSRAVTLTPTHPGTDNLWISENHAR